jgi:hypothetical protein
VGVWGVYGWGLSGVLEVFLLGRGLLIKKSSLNVIKITLKCDIQIMKIILLL